MMSKQKPSLRNGSQKRHPDAKKQGKFCPKWKLCWLFFYCEGVIHHEFLLRGQTVNEECYLKVMKRVREAVRRKRPDLWRRKNRLLCLHVPARSFLLIHDFLTKHETTVVPQPPYSPDLTPTDLFLFTKLESLLRGRRFESIQEIKGNSLEELRSIPQEAFQECLQNWKKR